MSWALVLGLAAGAYAFKLLGFFAIGQREIPPVIERCMALIPAALITALIVKDTFGDGQHLQIDERILGVAAATVAVWRRAPFVVVIVLAAAVTGGARAITGA